LSPWDKIFRGIAELAGKREFPEREDGYYARLATKAKLFELRLGDPLNDQEVADLSRKRMSRRSG
jgi:hypothetical protein